MNKTLSLILGATLTLAFSFSTTVNAAKSKPGKSNPSTNSVCDEVKDATKGLYGLCVAYCEAQVRPTDLSGDPATWGLKPSSANILRNYNKKMKEGDPQMPCVNYESACPAFAQEDLDRLGSYYSNSIVEKYEDENVTTLSENYEIPNVQTNSFLAHVRERQDGTFYGQLEIIEQQQPWEQYDAVYNVLGYSELTSEQADACSSMIRNHQEWDTAIDHSANP